MDLCREHADGVIARAMHLAGGVQLRPYRPSFQEFRHYTGCLLQEFKARIISMMQKKMLHKRPYINLSFLYFYAIISSMVSPIFDTTLY